MKQILLTMLTIFSTHAMVEGEDTKTINLVGFAGQVCGPIAEVAKNLRQSELYELVSQHINLPTTAFKLAIGEKALINPRDMVDLSEVNDITLIKKTPRDLTLLKRTLACEVRRVDMPGNQMNGNVIIKIGGLSVECWTEISGSSPLLDPLEGDLDGAKIREVNFKVGGRSVPPISAQECPVNFSLDYLVYLYEARNYIAIHPEEFRMPGSYNIRHGPIQQTFITRGSRFSDARERIKAILFNIIEGKYHFEIHSDLIP